MTKKDSWWKKYTFYKSDSIVEMVEKSPEEFMISRTEILQLVLDFKTIKNRLQNICVMTDASDAYQEEWESLSEEERIQRRAEYNQFTEEFRKIWDQV